MKRIRLTIAYDGTAFHGFQFQPGQRSVEGELNRALSELTGEDIAVIGASRTDSGVHALGNAAVFDTGSSIPPEKYPYALLRFLPDDLRVTKSCEVPSDWHPRRTECRKTYEYVYECGRIEDPKKRLYSTFQNRIPDVEKMREGASYLIGEHDFTSFANPASQVLMSGGSAVRTIDEIQILENRSGFRSADVCEGTAGGGIRRKTSRAGDENCEIVIRISGNGFLYHMVRIIAGTLMRVGCGLWEPERVREALEAKDRNAAGPTAEARGLTLIGIDYGDETC